MRNKLRKIHDFIRDAGKVKAELYWIKKLWYMLLLTLSTVYVWRKFDVLVNQSFAWQFDGNSLILILWLVLLLLPLFDSIEGYGFKLNRSQAEQERQSSEIKSLREEILRPHEIQDVKSIEEQIDINQRENQNE